MEDAEKTKINKLILQTFTPRQPVKIRELFSGRNQQIQRISESIDERSFHPVLFGDRGVGKTSLANIIAISCQIDGYPTFLTRCRNGQVFQGIFSSILSQVKLNSKKEPIGFLAKTEDISVSILDLAGVSECTYENVLSMLDMLEQYKPLFIIDEFDRVSDKETKTQIADLIKNISDRSMSSTIMIVGVAGDLINLIGDHQSIERNLLQVHLPRMSEIEIGGILESGERRLKMKFEPLVKENIVYFSQGVPYFTHLLALHSSRMAISAGRLSVSTDDLDGAVRKSIDDMERSLADQYRQATTTAKPSTFPKVLYAAALAKTDGFGTFSPTDIANVQLDSERPLTISALQYPLSKLTASERGAILTREGQQRRYKYRFTNPMMRQYVLLFEASQRMAPRKA